MSKQKLADGAGVSVRTLMEWCKPFMQDLRKLGLTKHAKSAEPCHCGLHRREMLHRHTSVVFVTSVLSV